MESKRKNNTHKMGLDIHRGPIKNRAISSINNSLCIVGGPKHRAFRPLGLTHCNLALGVGSINAISIFSALPPYTRGPPHPLRRKKRAAPRLGNTPGSLSWRSVILALLII